MAEIVQAVGETSLSSVVLDFCPDRFTDLEWIPEAYISSGKLMVRGTIKLPKLIKYPEIAKF